MTRMMILEILFKAHNTYRIHTTENDVEEESMAVRLYYSLLRKVLSMAAS